NYRGPATFNPYFTSPGNPLRQGYVVGFENWFQENTVLGARTGPINMNKLYQATEEGAMEALRVIQEYFPDATIENGQWGIDGGPFTTSKPTWHVRLPDGRMLNAGGILSSYYNQGFGVSISSDDTLKRSLQLA
ncbi:MAG: hypothetical protein ACRD7E_01915, partial [Bryobacteraceae bacterium]